LPDAGVVEFANVVNRREGQMAQTTVDGVEGVQALVGQHLGYSDWVTITQEQVNRFADATGDHQWIHVDPERAAKESPFGGPVAHGYLTLSLVPMLVPQIIETTGFRMGVNYGTEKVRFPSPVPVGSRVRAGATLDSATPFDGGVQLVMTVTVEVEGASKPSMVATTVSRRYL
jgi:acyl dehydratase